MSQRHRLVPVTLILVVLASLLLPGQARVAAAPPAGVQLIADQSGAIQGDTVTYHVLYHNVQGHGLATVALKVQVPEGFSVDDAGGAQWDATTRVLTWPLADVRTNAAAVQHFRLKVDNSVAAGATLTATGSLDVLGVVGAEVSKAPIVVGQETHQPFFIGFPDGQFKPTRAFTRAEAAAVVARIKQLPQAGAPANPYEDVAASHWAYGYINRVTAAGYMVGSGGHFRPDAPLSRAELVVLLLRLRSVEAVPLLGFTDAVGHWAADVLGTARALTWIDGVGLDTFNPDGATERQVAAKLFAIALFRRNLSDGQTKVVQHFPDVPPTLWSFGWIEEDSMVAHEASHGLTGEQLIRYRPDATHPL